MLQTISVSEIPTPSVDNDDPAQEFFELKLGAVHFGHLYLAQETYSLIWNGTLDFKYLDETARFFLHKQIDQIKSSLSFSIENYKFRFGLEKYKTDVSLIYSDQLIQYHFDYSEETSEKADEYKNLLEDVDNIFFARYDFRLKSLPFCCTFTAENSPQNSSKGHEMAFSLPRSQPVTKSLLRWIVKNHISFRELRLYLDYHYSTPLLAKVIRTGKA